MPKPSWAQTERTRERKTRAEKEKLYSEMVISCTLRPDGSTYTLLKPGTSEGAETNPEGRIGRRGRHSDAITKAGKL